MAKQTEQVQAKALVCEDFSDEYDPEAVIFYRAKDTHLPSGVSLRQRVDCNIVVGHHDGVVDDDVEVLDAYVCTLTVSKGARFVVQDHEPLGGAGQVFDETGEVDDDAAALDRAAAWLGVAERDGRDLVEMVHSDDVPGRWEVVRVEGKDFDMPEFTGPEAREEACAWLRAAWNRAVRAEQTALIETRLGVARAVADMHDNGLFHVRTVAPEYNGDGYTVRLDIVVDVDSEAEGLALMHDVAAHTGAENAAEEMTHPYPVFKTD